MKLSRSPYIIEVDDATQTGSKIELFLGADVGTANPTYTLSKLIPASNNTKTFYNISPYVREYYSFTRWQSATGLAYGIDTNTDYLVDYEVKSYNLIGGTYVLYQTETDTFVDGYNYFMDGYNATTPIALLDEGTYFYNYSLQTHHCLLYTSPSPRDRTRSRMPSSA